MPCGKRPIIKSWDRPRHIRVITPSRYEQNEASVKVHWKNVIKELELSYKDEQFWETNSETVRELVGPVIFQRIAKIFQLGEDEVEYEPQSEPSTVVPSEQFYLSKFASSQPQFSIMSEYEPSLTEEQTHDEQTAETWSESSGNASEDKVKTLPSARSLNVSKSLSKMLSKTFSRFLSKALSKSHSGKLRSVNQSETFDTLEKLEKEDSEAETDDDLAVKQGSAQTHRKRHRFKNPYYEMLYCNESETDMIKWKSKYKQKTFEVSASDEFSKRAEIRTKQISNDFFNWWVGLGNVEFKSEIKRPEDIEALFQVWFDEHASRGLVLDPKIIPCVLKTIATHTGVHKASCLKALRRQIAFDIKAETSPAHLMAFGSSLPHKLKHVPPQNNTGNLWHGVKIPEDLRSMACVWEDIQHLTATKAFQQWLVKHPQLAMPPFLKELHAPGGDKKQPFIVPSDFVIKGQGQDKAIMPSTQDLALPVSDFSIELKAVLSKLMNQ
ncbi:uncharacterized protein LOC113508307 [Trichoplusia ni]|uniref:Uncharacterized protein LOC113508307 n=1 Tax=Trichoplusia ni TaxID=7111 RepID=A0A7E5X1L5_TRINI|nr:uncharacterized protein LOC113508307 [Trichoplusia ni]